MERTPFDSYEDEFQDLIQQLTTALESTERDGALQQCRDLLKLMAVEVRMANRDEQREDWDRRLRCGKETLQSVCHFSNNQQSADLASPTSTSLRPLPDIPLGSDSDTSPRSPNNISNKSAHDALHQHEDMLARQNASLERARQVMQETEEIGAAIVDELQRNRETLQSMQQHTAETKSLTNRANVILHKMSQPWWNRR